MFPSARERFAGSRNMEFKVGSYDLILALNVVHAIPSLTQTIWKLQLLLASYNKLMLTE